GFSYATDAPLDMRMDPASEPSAAELVNEASERELQTIFRRYGEERYARQIARAIVRRRKSQPFERTGELVETIRAAIPAPARFGRPRPRQARTRGLLLLGFAWRRRPDVRHRRARADRWAREEASGP